MVRGPDITVLSGQTDSNPAILEHSFGDAFQVIIKTPATMPEVATVQLSTDFNTNYMKDGITLAAAITAAVWFVAPAGVTIAAAGLGSSFAGALLTAAAMRIHFTAGAGANRVFQTYKQMGD